jgi:hypothetical protein
LRTAAQIAELYYDRRRLAGFERQRMRDVCSLYEGDVAIDLSELSESERPAVVNFARMGINQLGMRAAGTMPVVEHLMIDGGRRDAARKAADKRRKINHGWWGESKLNLLMRQRARHLFAYGQTPVVLWPDMKKNMPTWQVRSPLDTFAAPTYGVGDIVPDNAIFAQVRTVGWVRMTFPHLAIYFHKAGDMDRVDVLEYVDRDQYHKLVCLAARPAYGYDVSRDDTAMWMATEATAATIVQLKNRAGVPWCVIPRAITLERNLGLFDGIFGMYQAQARLQALSLHARQKGVFQETWLVTDNENVVPEVLAQADAMMGQVGILRGGRFERVTPDPQYATDTGIDRLERAQQFEAGIPSAFGGQGISNTRSGRGVETVLGAATDPLLGEAHDIFVASLYEEDRIAIAMDKGYWGDESKRLFVSFNGEKGSVSYVPNDLWVTDEHIVRYPYPGGDADNLNIATGQAMGAGIMSRKTAASLNPLVPNPEQEFDQIVGERLQDAFLSQIQTMATTPGAGMEPVDLARLIQLVQDDELELIAAFQKVQAEAQARQARAAQTAEQMQPGVSPPGQGVEQPGQFQTTPDQQGLSKLMFGLRAPQMRSMAERV